MAVTSIYRPAFGNQVYLKDTSLPDENGFMVPLKAVIIPRRFTQGTEDQVVEYLQKAATEVVSSSVLPDGFNQRGLSELEKMLSGLPNQVLHDLRVGDKECLNFVRGHTRAPRIKEEDSPKYLFIRYGLVPSKVIESDAVKINSADWYSAVLLNRGLIRMNIGQRFIIKVMLEKGSLPKEDEVYVLLDHGTHGSRTLTIDRINYPIEEAKDVVGVVYREFSNPERLQLVKDVSEKSVEEFALESVMALIEETSEHEIS